jgi:hypothetical protein
MASRFAIVPHAALAAAALILFSTIPSHAGDATEQQLRRELDQMREHLRRVEQRLEEQDALLRKLSAPGGQGPAAAPAAGVDGAPASSVAPAATGAKAAGSQTPPIDAATKARIEQDVAADVKRALQPQLAASQSLASKFNPAIGLVIDAAYAHEGRGRDDFQFRSAELSLSASVDPFARAFVFLNGSEDDFEVEEAAIVTTSLPYNLAIQGGRFFADFGRLSKIHDHELPFVNRPLVLDRYVGGEAQADGVELSWLAPLESQYVSLTFGLLDKLGAENDRIDGSDPRPLDEFTYLGRVATYFPIGDAHGIDVGVSDAFTPEVDVDDGASRNLAGVDLTYRYSPPASAAYRGVTLGSEALMNSEEREPSFDRRSSFGMYGYAETLVGRRWEPGFLFGFAEGIEDDEGDTYEYSPYLSIRPSEFQRLRLQYTLRNDPDGHDSNRFYLQWTVAVGSHTHGFRGR